MSIPLLALRERARRFLRRAACWLVGHNPSEVQRFKSVRKVRKPPRWEWIGCTRCHAVLSGEAPPIAEQLMGVYVANIFTGVFAVPSPWRAMVGK